MDVIELPADVVFNGLAYWCMFSLPMPKNVLYRQVGKDGKIRGLTVKCSSGEKVKFDIENARLTTGTLRAKLLEGPYPPNDDAEWVWDSPDDTEIQPVIDELLQTITLEVDSHWDCYCKTRSVCGCGCDPKHDGW